MNANMKIVVSAYISEKWFDYDQISYTESGNDCDRNDMIKMQLFLFKMADGCHLKPSVLSDFRDLLCEDAKSETTVECEKF